MSILLLGLKIIFAVIILILIVIVLFLTLPVKYNFESDNIKNYYVLFNVKILFFISFKYVLEETISTISLKIFGYKIFPKQAEDKKKNVDKIKKNKLKKKTEVSEDEKQAEVSEDKKQSKVSEETESEKQAEAFEETESEKQAEAFEETEEIVDEKQAEKTEEAEDEKQSEASKDKKIKTKKKEKFDFFENKYFSYYKNLAKDEKKNLKLIFKSYFKNLLKCFKLKKKYVYMNFGFDNPKDTGLFLGALSIAKHHFGEDLQFVPEFNDKCFNYKAHIKGNIYIGALLINTFKLIMKKPIKDIINLIKS